MLKHELLAKVFHALGDPTRRAMLEQLSRGPTSVSALAEPLGVTLAAVMQHLQVLEDAQLAHSEKLGRVRTCRIEPRGLDVAAGWIGDRRSLWERRLDQLGVFLDDQAAAAAPPATSSSSTSSSSAPRPPRRRP